MRILLLAYACEPGKGSEPGVGWMWSRMLARFADVTVITRTNNRASVEAALPSTPEADHLTFEYVDLPTWARFWKRGQRGIRAYYLLWQLAALRAGRRRHRTGRFDLVWHVTMSTYWLGSVGGLVGPPFVFGPVSGGVPSCFDVRIVGARGLFYEMLRSVARSANELANPLVRSSWARSSLILVNNAETAKRVPRSLRGRTEVFPNILLDPIPMATDRRPGTKTALFAGRLLHWKGVSLALRAIARCPGWRLVICGSGPDEDRLRRRVRKLGLDDRVDFRGWVDRRALQALMREASVFVFPSVHDEAGWALAEASAAGARVVCIRRGGPPEVVGTGSAVPLDGLGRTVRSLAAAIRASTGDTRTASWDIDARQGALSDVLRRHGLITASRVDA